MSFSAVILAAGQGTRMNSVQPKVLQLLAGKPLLHHVLDTLKELLPAQTLVVCGYRGAALQENCAKFNVDWVWQQEQLGTGHAMKVAYPDLNSDKRVLVLYGDVPLIQTATLKQFLEHIPVDALGILTAKVANPSGLGRVVRDSKNQITQIVEEKDATREQCAINEINSGIYVLPYKHLAAWLNNLTTHNQQQEYYLTDLVQMAVKDGVSVQGFEIQNELEITGVNSQSQLMLLERKYQLTQAEKLLAQGVKLYDAARLDIRGNVQAGKDVIIDVNVLLEGEVILGDNVYLGPNVYIRNSQIESGSKIYANSVLDGAIIGSQCEVGPFARIRPGTELHAASKIGNFVETKNTVIGEQTKINHLSYVGDASVGNKVNIGAGVITCNYDGAFKHKTIIEDEVFVGSNCELIAPVTIGKGATIAAGTTLTKDAPPGALTLTKKVLANIFSWQRPVKNKEKV